VANTIRLGEWLCFIEEEYLSTFIKEGGASIKFAVTEDGLKPALYEAVERRCRELDCIFVKIDAAKTRVYMPQDIFFEMAKQVDWRLSARRLVLRFAKESGYRVDAIDPSKADNIFAAIGEVNDGLDPTFVLHELRPRIQDSVFKEYQMAKDFRVAMSHLCLAANTDQPVIDWLTGDNTKVSSVKPFAIHTPINRTTARHFIQSALFWFWYVGHGGTVIVLDSSRVTVSRNPRDGLKYYTKPMAMDHYELLREYIDETDKLIGALLIVVTDSAFLDYDDRSRGFGMYQALMTRVMDDVRDKELVNPIASLVRLS